MSRISVRKLYLHTVILGGKRMDRAEHKAMKVKIKAMTDDELYDAILATGQESDEEMSYSYALAGEAERRPDGWESAEGFLSHVYAKRLEKSLIGLSWIGMGLLATANVQSVFAGHKILDRIKSILGEERLQQLLEEHPEKMTEFWGDET